MYDGKQVRIYYHCFLTEDKTWVFTLLDQLEMLVNSGLMDVVDYFPTFVGGSVEQINIFKEIVSHYPKIVIKQEKNVKRTNDSVRNLEHNFPNTKNDFCEKETMHQIWLDSKEKDFHFLYLQLKSVTAFALCFEKNVDVTGFLHDFKLRKFLEKINIIKWKECLDNLEKYNMVGGNLKEDRQWKNLSNKSNFVYLPRGYKGNIFWSKSSHIEKLTSIMDDTWWNDIKSKSKNYIIPDRWYPEFWPLSLDDDIENYLDIKGENYSEVILTYEQKR